jgi:hypothetical protein
MTSSLLCTEFVERVQDNFEKLGDIPLEPELVLHLEECPPCELYLEQMIELKQILHEFHLTINSEIGDGRIKRIIKAVISYSGE